MGQKIKNTGFESIINAVCIIVLAGVFGYLILNWNHLPNQIPAHYDANGTIDRWGNKNELWLCPIISLILFIIFTVIEKYLITWEIKMNNGTVNSYRVSKQILMLVKMILIIAFSYITINSAGGHTLPNAFTVILLGAIFAVLVIGLIQYMYLKKKMNRRNM
ncbi:DUF1648 domain-containing protein [Beduini massiliensis]|uniref:DUF1648 domain-containing protein n=1 Tax=Beduini massiliensis TaxID=1585974 RepID=UPI00059A82EF|nr:DUF1648 domain-containing protein [Beduini massiliensis]